MPRKLIKKWIVNKVENRDFGITVPISVDPKNGGFWAEYPEGDVIARGSQEALIRAVKVAIKRENQLEWTPKIAVQAHTDHWHSGGKAVVGIGYLARYEQATIIRQVPHRYLDEMVTQTIHRYRYFGDTTCGRYSERPPCDAVIFDYDEALWQRLKDMETTFIAMRDHLNALLGRQEGEEPEDVAKRIMANTGGFALPGPVEEPPKKRKKVPPPPPKRK